MAYTPPLGGALEFTFLGELPYTPPAYDAVDLSFAADTLINITAAITVVAAQSTPHGVELAGIASVQVSASMGLEYVSVDIDIALAATIPVAAASDVVYGVALAGVATIPVSAELGAVQGVSVAASAVISVTALQNVVHGVALDGIAIISLSADADVLVERYELRGQVRLGGVLVNRRVRAYQRTSGALIGEVDTVVGMFRLHTGFTPDEHYITPIDLAAEATDWSPPTANRVLSLLALDTA